MAKHPHLALRRLEGELPRRKRTFVPQKPTWTPQERGHSLLSEVAEVVASVSQPRQDGNDPLLIVKMATGGYVDETALQRVDLTVLQQSMDSSIIVYSDDNELTQFQNKAAAYRDGPVAGQKNAPHANLFDAIEHVVPLAPADRIGPALRGEGYFDIGDFSTEELFLLDAELWKPSDDMAAVFISRVDKLVSQYDGELLSEYYGPDTLLVRIRANGEAVGALLQMPEVALLDLPPSVDFSTLDVADLAIDDLPIPQAPSDGAVIIGVVDSGITAEHPLLKLGVFDAFGVPPSLGSDDEKGHGTSVAGIAMYGDLEARLQAGQLAASFKIASAKVVDHTGNFDDDDTVPAVMDTAIRRLVEECGCKVVNISLADRHHPVADRPSAWAAALDTLARELDLIIVVAAGNVSDNLNARMAAEGTGIYPSYLLSAQNRIFEPGSAANAIVVGSISHSNGLNIGDADYVDIIPLAEDGAPSPFTRSGPGCGNNIKPDFVDRGGTAVWHGGNQRMEDARYRNSAGILSLHEDYIRRLFAYRSGTSFAAPLVAYKAALLREAFPNATANLTRALLAVSSDHPSALVGLLKGSGKGSHLQLGGHGVPDVERALESEESRVVLVSEDRLGIDRFAVYEVPIPTDFQHTKGRRHIRVALAYDPPVRRTRKEYLGVKMGFHLVRGASEKEVFDQFREWERNTEGEPFRLKNSLKCTMEPGPVQRETGTLQVATFTAQSNISNYGDKYFLAVRCEGKWAKTDIDEQRFAVVVELWHEAELALYQSLDIGIPA
jgi:subtilisin family serine protease